MKSCGCVLQQSHSPLALLLHGDEYLNRVDFRIDVRLSGWNHPDDSPQECGLCGEESHLSDLGDIGSSLVLAENLLKMGLDLLLSAHRATVEANGDTTLGKFAREANGVSGIPALEHGPVESPNCLHFLGHLLIIADQGSVSVRSGRSGRRGYGYTVSLLAPDTGDLGP